MLDHLDLLLAAIVLIVIGAFGPGREWYEQRQRRVTVSRRVRYAPPWRPPDP